MQTKKLLDAWKGVALMQATSMDVVHIQQAIRAKHRTLDADAGEMVLVGVERRTQALKAQNPSAGMIAQILELRRELSAFRSAAE